MVPLDHGLQLRNDALTLEEDRLAALDVQLIVLFGWRSQSPQFGRRPHADRRRRHVAAVDLVEIIELLIFVRPVERKIHVSIVLVIVAGHRTAGGTRRRLSDWTGEIGLLFGQVLLCLGEVIFAVSVEHREAPLEVSLSALSGRELLYRELF